MNKVILIVMDGLGLAKKDKGNCVAMAKTPCLNWMKTQNFTQINASGEAVGLSKGIQGNSEVGHLTMGAGRIVLQPLEKINHAIKNKSFYKNKELIKAINYAKKNNSSLHLIGMISDEGVHSHLNHLNALLELAEKLKQKKVFVHAITDGRDVAEKSAEKYIKKIESNCKKLKLGKIASVCGRFYAMDRDNNWNRTKKAFELITEGKGIKEENALKAVKNAYEKGTETDYYIEPIIVDEKGIIKEKDSVIFFNYRTDRPRQLSLALTSKKFNYFKRNKFPKIHFTSMTQYSKEIPASFAFKEEKIKNNLGETLARNKLKQLRIAETEKYAHVTYFFNSQKEKPLKGETRILIPSLKDKSYDLHPKMSAEKITETALKEIRKQKFDFILINYANCDLVGHSAKIPAVIKAVETVDSETCKIIHEAEKNNYISVVTADHGSAEEKLYPNGKPKPAHSSNPIPFIIIGKKVNLRKGGLKDVAPTILKLMNLKKPKEMSGKTLF
ncbi:MAG: 2,3-bisphosphoglycerate-independent phosphoglycerate mutase [Candidatus Diapherotrites archaeon]|nr:2,3-bisphosphoglycerate-independent phosphoglycerate mutase [Candidatus Diapherotrites archaeon]